MKQLRFFEPLPGLVLARTKDTTWRINDDKDLQKGDLLSLVNKERIEFAKAKVLWTRDTTFGELTKRDTEGHEKFASTGDMLDTYSKYYNQLVTLDTPVKVVKFTLL